MGVKIAAIQMDIIHKDPEGNRKLAKRLMQEALVGQPDILVLPETWTTGYSEEVFATTANYAETAEGPSVTMLRDFAKANGIWIAGGSLVERYNDKLYNTVFLIDRQGDIRGRYRKMHLYSAMDEDKGFSHGTEMPVFDTEFGKLALMTCYDIRFVELSRTYAVGGAQMIIVVSNFPKPKLHHWRLLLQARAIENQLFVVACNRVGKAGPSDYFGHSIIVDPWGEVLTEAGEEETILHAELDPAAVQAVREKIPMYYDRRPADYPNTILKKAEWV